MEKLVHLNRSSQNIAIPIEHVGQRVDNFLLSMLKGVPRTHVYKILRTGQVRVNSHRIRASYRLIHGDCLRLPPVRVASPPLISSSHHISWMADQILYEDKGLLIFNKPTGMAVHGGSGISLGVIEGLRLLRPESHYLELAHRLDRGTSGCLIIAKTRNVLRQLHDLFREGGIQKTYLTLVAGRWDVGRKVSLPLLLDQRRKGERVVIVSPQGKAAQTKFQVRKRFDGYTLLVAKPITGRTHQIRVHASYMGYPVCGDERYGDKKVNVFIKSLGLSRLFLHASRLRFILPEIQKQVEVSCSIPKNLEDVLEKLN